MEWVVTVQWKEDGPASQRSFANAIEMKRYLDLELFCLRFVDPTPARVEIVRTVKPDPIAAEKSIEETLRSLKAAGVPLSEGQKQYLGEIGEGS